MEYLSTRGQALPLLFRDTVMTGLAPDGGLFLPENLPDAGPRLGEWRDFSFLELFQQVAGLFMAGALPAESLREMTKRSYARFDHPEITPVVRLGGYYLVELFHGPTFAFKDIALQFLGNLFENFLARTERRLTVVGATSGDTGSAAIQALRGKVGIEVFILFPRGRVSPMQERQMTTVTDPNIHPIAMEGSFDDAQDIVKGLFNDREFNSEHSLGAVNSINWARVMAQIVYFFYAYFRVVQAGACRLGDPVRFSVPTGNFGHIFAGYLAKGMGLPIEKLLLATNANDILHRFVSNGTYRKHKVVATHSPSMDIQVASNFERYLHYLAGGESAQVVDWMEQLRNAGEFSVSEAQLSRVRTDFLSSQVGDEATMETIREIHREEGYLLDPHSAVGLRAAMDHPTEGIPVICMATAHPAKFTEAITKAIGVPPPIPPALAGLDGLATRVETLPASLESIRHFIRHTLAAVDDSAKT